MKWPKRLIVTGVAMLTAAAALTLTACSKNSDSSNDGKVTIEYFNQKTDMVDTLKEIIKDFEKENPKIHVKMTSVPSAGTVLKTRMLAGDAPDVINIYPQNVDFKEWAKAGYFENMTGKSYLKNIKNHYEKKYQFSEFKYIKSILMYIFSTQERDNIYDDYFIFINKNKK